MGRLSPGRRAADDGGSRLARRRGEAEAPRRILERVCPDPQRGLTADQAAALLENGYDNRAEDPNTKSVGRIIRENTLTFFNLVFVVLAVLLAVSGNFTDMTFLVIAFLNSLIGIVQQLRSRAALAKLNLLAESRVQAVRDGRLCPLPVHELVREDIVELKAGDQIPADGPVVSGRVRVNEALLTGEADPLEKGPGDRLLSGSFVVSGRCRARMDQVGAESYAARLSREAKADAGVGRSEMMHSLDRLIRVIGFALIPIGAALFYKEYVVQGNPFSDAIPAVVAALVGMIPEGLSLLTSVALAGSVLRLARRRTLVHEMSAIETLARVDVLCVDKTGTITQPEMAVRQVVLLDETRFPEPLVEDLLTACCAALDAENDTGRALAARFCGAARWPAERTVPFASDTKWSAVVFREQGSYVLGAPDVLLRDSYQALEPRILPFQEAGCRVLLFAACSEPPVQGRLGGDVHPVALLVLHNPIRPEAPGTFQYFARQGVAVKVISGDHPAAVSRIARQAGIEGAERYVDASELKTPEDCARAAGAYTVFGRVTPEQKRQLVQALRADGHTVAMTGDGVNDVLALKDADCGIAMASGADAACQVAQLVLLDSDFSALPNVVAEGRRVINNIQRSASLYLVKNILSFFLSLITLAAGFPYPFVPIQLTLISTLTIGIPSFVLALEPNHDLVRGKFMQNVLRRALPGGLTNIVLIVGIELFTLAFTFERATLSTLATVLMGVVGLLVLYYISRPLDWKRGLLLGSMTVAMAVAIFGFGDFFSLTPLDFQSALVITVFLLLAPSVIWFFEQLFVLGSALLRRTAARRKASRRRRRP